MVPLSHPIFFLSSTNSSKSQDSRPTDAILCYFHVVMCLLALSIFTAVHNGTLCSGVGDGGELCLLVLGPVTHFCLTGPACGPSEPGMWRGWSLPLGIGGPCYSVEPVATQLQDHTSPIPASRCDHVPVWNGGSSHFSAPFPGALFQAPASPSPAAQAPLCPAVFPASPTHCWFLLLPLPRVCSFP